MKCKICNTEMELEGEFWKPMCKCYPDDLRIVTLEITSIDAICLKCNTKQTLIKIFTGIKDKKEKNWCWWCNNCKDRINQSAIKEVR